MSVEELTSPGFAEVVFGLSWSHRSAIMGSVTRPEPHYFYMAMAVRERWSVRELRRQLDAGLFTRYVSVKCDPEKCLPAAAEQGGLLPFKDHCLLDFLGLEYSHTERQLRQAMLANLRDLFLELGRDFTFIGEGNAVFAGDDTFRVDLLLFHRETFRRPDPVQQREQRADAPRAHRRRSQNRRRNLPDRAAGRAVDPRAVAATATCAAAGSGRRSVTSRRHAIC